jgi:hypothetical protein
MEEGPLDLDESCLDRSGFFFLFLSAFLECSVITVRPGFIRGFFPTVGSRRGVATVSLLVRPGKQNGLTRNTGLGRSCLCFPLSHSSRDLFLSHSICMALFRYGSGGDTTMCKHVMDGWWVGGGSLMYLMLYCPCHASEHFIISTSLCV